MKAFLLSLFFLSSSINSAQILTKTAVQEDLKLLKQSILDYNPAVEIYNPNFREQADSLMYFPEDVSIYEAFTKISQMCALANEGHFQLGTWEDAAHSGIYKDEAPFLPLSLKIVQGKIYVWADFNGEELFSKGDQILAINTFQDTEIIEQLLSCTPSDGNIETYSIKKISDNFPWFYYFYLEQPKDFTIQFLPKNSSEIKTIAVPALTKSERKENFQKRNEPKPQKEKSLDDFYEVEFKENYTLLKLKTFDYRLVDKFEIDAQDFYEELFQSFQEKEVQNLVIDLRGNTGGRNAFGDEIVPFILKENVESPFLSKSVSWKGKEKTTKMPKRSKFAFDGKIYALVDGYTYSNGGTVAHYLKELGDATFIGEESGTRYEGFVAGSAEYVTLPNTQIRIGIPRYHKFFPTSEKQKTKNCGLIPDYEIELTVEDVLNEKDLAMEKVELLISKK